MTKTRRIKWTSLFLALVCLVSIVGCQSSSIRFSVEYQKVISEAESGFSFLFDDFEKDDQFFHGWFRTKLIRSEAELKEYFDLNQKPEERQAFLEQCDADYFENHAVLYVRMIHTSATPMTMTVNPITRLEDQLTVNLYYEDGLPDGADVFSAEEIFIKVKKSDVDGVTQVVCVSPDDRQNESK